jgi:hypothetical protein
VTDAAIDMDRFKSKRKPAAAAPPSSDEGKACNAPTRLPRHQGLWASVPLAELIDRRNDGIYSARARLLLYLTVKSRRGQRPVRLTNEMAAEIGLDRPLKCKTLRYLESQGRVTVVQVGQQAPWVTLLQTSPHREPLPESNGSLPESNTGLAS